MDAQKMELTLGMGRGHRNIMAVVQFIDGGRKIRELAGYPFMYSIRGSDNDCGAPSTIEAGEIWVNFIGRAFTKEPLPMGADEYRPIRDWGFID